MKKKIDDLDFALTNGREEYKISRAVFLRLLNIVSEMVKDEAKDEKRYSTETNNSK